MVNSLILVKSESTNVYVNQGIEKALFDGVNDGEYILYLWSNDNTVVIGRNQDAYMEVDVDLLKKENGYIARRLSGGGAVFHDLGNLNFTFISKRENFSLEKNREVILNALNKLGLDAYLTGRNDIEIDGCKISGNAYYKYEDKELHHGTMLVTSLKDQVARYLTPSKAKFAGKSVKSVKSRVASLNEFKAVTKEDFALAIKDAFKEEFNLPLDEISSSKIMNAKSAFFSNDEWIFGRNKEYKYKIYYEENRIRYDIVFNVENNRVMNLEVFTDSLDIDDAEKIYRRIYKEDINQDNELMKKIKEATIC